MNGHVDLRPTTVLDIEEWNSDIAQEFKCLIASKSTKINKLLANEKASLLEEVKAIKIDQLHNAEGFVAARTEGHTKGDGKWHVSTRPTFIKWDEVPEELRPQDLESCSPTDLDELKWKITHRAVEAFNSVDERMLNTNLSGCAHRIRVQVEMEGHKTLESLYTSALVFSDLDDARPALKRLAHTGSATRALFGCYQAHTLFGSTLTLPSFIRDAVVPYVLGHRLRSSVGHIATDWKTVSYAWFSMIPE